ncbi:MAG: winged helix-turn-helix transcriptional regulator [Fibrobacteres bacterium]|jgi:DNA-binding transcriptional ArsR family regulator|nr:winged helix-turn-helix transcriptional regulator [Fibrobacterota bacterium]
MSKVEPGAAGVFSALGDGTRLELLRRLGAGPLSATSLAERAPVTRQAVVKHLRVLESAGLVKHEKLGREVLFALEPRRIEDARAYLDAVSAGWDKAIERLRLLVEEPANPVAKRVKR